MVSESGWRRERRSFGWTGDSHCRARTKPAHTKQRISMRLCRSVKQSSRAKLTANFLGLSASKGKPIRKATAKHTAAPAVHSRNPENRSHRDSAKYLSRRPSEFKVTRRRVARGDGRGGTSVSDVRSSSQTRGAQLATHASSSLVRSPLLNGIPPEMDEVKRPRREVFWPAWESSVDWPGRAQATAAGSGGGGGVSRPDRRG